MQAMRERDYATAIKYFEKLGKHIRSDAQLAKAAGFAHLQTGNDERALFFLNTSLANRSSQPDVHAALGDIHVRLSNKEKALAHLRKAVTLAPDEPELRYKLGLALLGFDQPGDAVEEMRAALAITPGFTKAQLGLGRCLTELGQFDEAEAALKQADKLAPKNYAVAFRLGKLKDKQGQREQAIAHYREAETLSDHSAPICEALALLELAKGDTSAALATLQRGLSKSPLNRDLLKNAAELRYEMADPDAFSFYSRAMEIRPLAGIHADYIGRLLAAEQTEVAARELEKYAASFGRGPDWMSLAARHQYSTGAFQEALTTLARAPSDHADLSIWKARALLGCGDSLAAQKLLRKLLKTAPGDQFLLSMLSTCYRLNDPVAYKELVDYDALLIQAELEVPDGYSSLEQFNDVLRDTLQELHVTRGNPLSQSVKGGTQTPGNLFHQPHPVIGALKQAFHATLSRELGPTFFDRLDKAHPVSVGRNHPINLSAAWSIWVTEGGYHKYHVHQRGWYSSAYYVSLPSEMKHSAEAGNQGILAFGKPGLEIPEKLDADKIITPAEGVLALFPSYFWHGTLPFKSSEPRVVVAFDALPGK
jgi:Flp pilus assembly protein TadD